MPVEHSWALPEVHSRWQIGSAASGLGPGTVLTAGRVTQALQGPVKCPLGLSSESEECTNLLPIGILLYVDILVISWT